MARVCRSGHRKGLTPPPPYTQPIARAVDAQPDDSPPQVNTSTCSAVTDAASMLLFPLLLKLYKLLTYWTEDGEVPHHVN